MRNTVFCFLMLGCITAFAQKGITFDVEKLSKPNGLLRTKSYDDIYKELVLSDLEMSLYKVNKDKIVEVIWRN